MTDMLPVNSSDRLSSHVESGLKASFAAMLDGCENWIYTDEGENASLATYVDKMSELTVRHTDV